MGTILSDYSWPEMLIRNQILKNIHSLHIQFAHLEIYKIQEEWYIDLIFSQVVKE